LLICKKYKDMRKDLEEKVRTQNMKVHYLLRDKKAVKYIIRFVENTKRSAQSED
jgi:hypothetical protein